MSSKKEEWWTVSDANDGVRPELRTNIGFSSAAVTGDWQVQPHWSKKDHEVMSTRGQVSHITWALDFIPVISTTKIAGLGKAQSFQLQFLVLY